MKEQMQKIYTIGYEGASAEQLIQTLVNLKIEVLADVRELPLSRKKGFSKKSLAKMLSDVGIEYRHYKQLGDPKPGRDAAKSGDFKTFSAIFTEHMQKIETKTALRDLLLVALKKRTCMLCFERCAIHCHRSIIAYDAVRAGYDVHNIVADMPERYVDVDLKIPSYNPSQSIAAAE